MAYLGKTLAGLLQSEDGPWANDTVSYTYTNRMRQSMTLGIPSGSALSTTYDYDGINRLKHIVSWTGTFTYSYKNTPSTEVLGITLPTAAYITNTFDGVARETATKLYNSSGSPLNYHNYGYNNLSQRTYQTNNSGNYTAYTYDKTGQLLTASGTEGSTNRANEQLKYSYDAAGNLYQRTNNALIQTFGVDNLNQLSTAARTGTLTVGGATSTNVSSVTVNDGTTTVTATRYGDNSFAATNFTLVSGSKTYSAIGVDGSGNRVTNSVIVNLASSVTYTYDADGNLTNDGVRTFSYDEENQLTNVSVSGSWKVEFQYDGKMRRRVMKEYNLNGTVTNEVHYVYDGNVVVEERDWNNTLRVGYVRGKDLSGQTGSALNGAGGIGGLLARVDYTTGTAVPAYYHSDANGNVTCLTDGSQNVVARYAYDPYGNLLAKSGSLADVNAYRFSSKEWNENSGLVYYLYRFYDPNLQRWLNRDPIGEGGFWSPFIADWVAFTPNLMIFVQNNPITYIDPLGLTHADPQCSAGCAKQLDQCMTDIANLASNLGIGGVGGLGWGHQTAGGVQKWFTRAGELTSYAKNLLKGSGYGIGLGALCLAAQCGGAFAGCMSGCPGVPDITPPMFPYANVNAPPVITITRTR